MTDDFQKTYWNRSNAIGCSVALRVAYSLTALLFVSAGVVLLCVLGREGDGVLTVAFLNVGQGDAVYIETPNGNQVLLDGGNGKTVLRELGSVMAPFDKDIDGVIASHPDLDHIGGLLEVFERFSVSSFYDPGVQDDGADYAALLHAVQKGGAESYTIRAGTFLMLDEGVRVQFLFPDRDAAQLEPNTGSVVFKLTYGDTSFLFTGDSPTNIEAYLVSVYGNTLKSDVLKLGHHGSKTSSSELFLGYVDPTYAVISAGCDNPYGHPHTEVLDRIVRFGIEYVTTCKDGTILFTSDGKEVTFVQ